MTIDDLKSRSIDKDVSDFDIIRNKLIDFNNEEDVDGAPNPNRKKIRIDYDSIYEIKNLMVTDFDAFGNRVVREANEAERKEELAKQAYEAFGVNLNKSLTFMNMISKLTEEVEKINKEEEAFLKGEKSNVDIADPSSKLFSTNDLLYTFETVLGKSGTKSNVKPNEESVKLLSIATINIDRPKDTFGYGTVVQLTQEEIDDIIDKDFILGC